MRGRIVAVMLILIIVLGLAGCGEEAVPLPPETAAPSSTASATPAPPTSTVTSVPRPTHDPSEPIYPKIEFSFSFATSTPIPTPAKQDFDYQLQDPGLEGYIDLLLQLENYSYEKNIPNEWALELAIYQPSIALVIQDVIEQYPNSPYSDELNWKLASANAIDGNRYSDDWILQEIEDAINTGKTNLENLDSYLQSRGFKVFRNLEMDGLFGNDSTATVFIINSNVMDDYIPAHDGLVVAGYQEDSGIYNFEKVVSGWDIRRGEWRDSTKWEEHPCQDYQHDLNKNGKLELCLFYMIGATGSFPTKLFLFEWQNGEFVNLAENFPGLGYGKDHEFSPSNRPGIDLEWRNELLGDPEELFRYVWQNDSLELVEAEFGYLFDEIGYLYNLNQNSEVINLLKSQISNGPPYRVFAWQTGKNPMGDEGTDTLRFLIGMAYAYNGDIESARPEFLSLAKNPANPDFPFLSEIAQLFVDGYFDSLDIYGNCTKAVERVEELLPRGSWDEEIFERVFGYEGYIPNPIAFGCDLRSILLVGMSKINSKVETSLPEFLVSKGFRLEKFEELSLPFLDRNGYILLANFPASDSYAVYIAVPYEDEWVTQEIERYCFADNLENFRYDILPTRQNEETLLLVGSGCDVSLHRISLDSEGIFIDHLFSDPNLGKNYFVLEGKDSIKLITKEVWDDYDPVTETEYQTEIFYHFEWDPNLETFIEDTTSVFDDPEYIIELSNYDPSLNPSIELALAYELTGNEAKAVETYWRVWAEDPGSAWALIARAKLEGVQP